MSVAKVIEITSSSANSFEDAVRNGINRASETVDDVKGAWVKDHEVVANGGEIVEYRVRLKVTFIVSED